MTDVCPPKEEAVSSSSSLVLPKQRCGESQLTNENPKQFKEVSLDTVAIERGDWLTDTHISSVNEILLSISSLPFLAFIIHYMVRTSPLSAWASHMYWSYTLMVTTGWQYKESMDLLSKFTIVESSRFQEKHNCRLQIWHFQVKRQLMSISSTHNIRLAHQIVDCMQ